MPLILRQQDDVAGFAAAECLMALVENKYQSDIREYLV